MHAVTDVKPVPFLDLSGEYQALEAEWFALIRECGQSGAFILGKNVTALEQEFARYVGAQHAVAVANGTDALVLSLRALDIGPGDEVITTPFTFFATAEAVTIVGATPVFVDIDAASFNLDPAQIAARITPRTRAIIPVHLYGNPAAMPAIQVIAQQHKLAVIEDCAQAFGAQSGTQRVGSLGETGCFSFYPTKVLGCYGDGGMITTHSAETADKLRRLRNHGAVQPFVHHDVGYNSRLDEIQAALLRLKLKRVDAALAGRQRVASAYDEGLRQSGLALPLRPRDGRHAFNLYTVRSPERDRLRQRLTEAKVASSVCYPVPLHLQQVYAGLGYRAGDLPRVEAAAQEVLSLPIFPDMSDAMIRRVCEVVGGK